MSSMTNQQQHQQLLAKDMDDATRARIEYLSSMIQSIYKGIESGATNHTKGLQLMQYLELESGINIAWNGSSQAVTASPRLVSAPSSATTSTAASTTTSPQTLPHNHDAELRLDPLELGAASAPLYDWQIETLVGMLSKPDEVNNPPQKKVKPDALLDLSTLFQIIGKGIDSGTANCTYEQAVQLLKRLHLWDLVLNGIVREEGSRLSSPHFVSPSASVPASTAASSTSSPRTLPQYNDDAELQQDLLVMGAESLFLSPLIQTPPTSPKLAATPAPLLKTTELTRQITPDEQQKKEATSVVRHNSISNVQQRQVAQQAPAKLPLKKRRVREEKNQASFLPTEQMEPQHPRVSSLGMKSMSSLSVSTSKTAAGDASSSMIQSSLCELVREQQSRQAMLDREEERKKLFQQRVFSTAKMPPKKKASSKKKTATIRLRPDKVCRDESCGSTKQAGYDGYCIKHCKEFNRAKYEETKEQKAEKKKAAEKKAAE